MIIKESNDMKVFKHLIAYYYKEYSIKEFSKEIKLSIPKLYKTLASLKKKNLLIKTNKIDRFKVCLDNIYTQSIKKVIGAEKIINLPYNISAILESFKDRLLLKYEKYIRSIVVFGSIAADDFKEKSDIDIFIIAEDKEKIDFSSIPFEGHTIVKDMKEINQDFMDGDDFLISILKCHIIYYDPNDAFYSLLLKPFPKVSKKVLLQREERLKDFQDSVFNEYKNKHFRYAIENFKKFLIAKARLELVKNNQVPVSKKDTLIKAKRYFPYIIEDYNSISKDNFRNVVMKYV